MRVFILSASAVLILFSEFSCLTAQEQQGWPVLVSESESGMTNIVIGDVEGDGDLEVCVATPGGIIALYHHDGVPVEGWPIDLGVLLYIAPTPTIVDVDHDGDLEIFLPAGNQVFGLHHDGTSVPGWPVTMGRYTSSNSTIAAGDIDGDGDYELTCGSNTTANRVFVWHHNGVPAEGWPIRLHGWVSTSPSLADFDKDGDLEIVVNTADDLSSPPEFITCVFNKDGTIAENWPQDLVNSTNKCSPAIGDIDQDGELEIVSGTSWDFTEEYGWIYAWNFDGTPVNGWPLQIYHGGEISDVALGDVDGDSKLEVVATLSNARTIYVINGEDATVLPGWPQPQDNEWNFADSPVLSDIDGDDELEIIATAHRIRAYPPYYIDSRVYAYDSDGTLLPGFPLELPMENFKTPTIVDLDGDGDLEIGVSSFYGIFLGSGPAYIHFWDLEAPINEALQAWPTYCHDHHQTGLYGQFMPEEAPVTVSLTPDTLEASPADTLRLSVTLQNRNAVYESFLAAAFLTLSDGTPFPGNPFIGPYSLRLPMQSSLSHEFHFLIPPGAPPGWYTMTGYVGKTPAWIYDSDTTSVLLEGLP